ncbi:MAG: response regulator [Acidobacteriia bacterium]|nr:response regulator [Terriglobia bacterium]
MLLLIDDDPDFRDQAQERLTLGPLLAVNDAKQAAQLITSGSEFSLALIDLDLPEIDGFRVIEELKKTRPTLPIVAISGVYSSHVLESAKLVGADEVLSKPIGAEWHSVLNRVSGVSHKKGTGHFRCRCGERLVFGRTGTFTPLARITRVGKLIRGQCPNCGLFHFVQY